MLSHSVDCLAYATPSTYPSKMFRVRLAVCVFACSLFLSSCAAQKAYRDGTNLVEQGKMEEGLAKLQEASSDDPRNVKYRFALVQTREHFITNTLEQAYRLTSTGKIADAEKQYQRVLSIDAQNDRAHSGLRTIELTAKHELWLQEARTAWDKKDTAIAQMKLREILTENPENQAALALNRVITEKTFAAPVESQLAAAYSKPITIEFKDVALKQVFEVISRTSGLNILFDKDVKTDQKTSIFLKNGTIASAIDYMLMTNQLEEEILDANTVLIYPNSPAKQKDYQRIMIKSFFLTNADVKSVADMLKTMVKTQNIFVDERLNVLMVRDNPAAIRIADKLISMMDAPEPEVMLEVEVIEIKRSRLLNLGIQWPGSLSLTPLPSAAGGVLTLHDLGNISHSTLGAGIGPATANANIQDSDVNILANPRIRTRNHEKAKILIGDRVPNITTTSNATGFVSDSINYLDVGLKLEVEPSVYLDNDVAIKISLEVSSIVSQIQSKNGSSAYQIGTRNASTVLRLKDGENQVLAGLINDEDRKSANKIPGFGDLPIIGRLFGSTSDDHQKTEIVLSITPHLIRNIQRPDTVLAELDTGTENNLHMRTDNSAYGAVQHTPALMPTTGQQNILLPNSSLIPPNAASRAMEVDPSTPKQASTIVGLTGQAVETNRIPESVNNPGNVIATTPNPVSPNAATPNNNPTGTDSSVRTPAEISAALLQWQGPTTTKVGGMVTVMLTAESQKPITSVPMAVGFDKRIFEVVDVTEGNFLNRDGGQTKFTKRVNSNGQILMTATRIADGGATLSGNLVAITFRALAPVDGSSIQLLTLTPVGLNGITVAAPMPLPKMIKVEP